VWQSSLATAWQSMLEHPEIARQFIVAPGTVKAHTASIYRKLSRQVNKFAINEISGTLLKL
jgi:DNA-binding NarL/FixJ family response regulator